MGGANHRLKQLELLRQTESPAARQTDVVMVLRCKPRGSSEPALCVKHLEQVRETDTPGTALLVDQGPARPYRSTVTTATVDVHRFDSLHCHGAAPPDEPSIPGSDDAEMSARSFTTDNWPV